jgi:ubiquinone/menaquinone biosynthesis C-methylase UbiE
LRQLNNYDLIARNYDWLSRLIYGKTLIHAQLWLLSHIQTPANLLIVGGGTGWIIEELTAGHPNSLKVDYVELSGKMISLAKQRNIGTHEVNFFQQDIESYTTAKKYDVIITAFLFDNFSDNHAAAIFNHLDTMMTGEGQWLFADFFQEGQSPFWQKWMLKIMYLFFRLSCNVEATQLPSVEQFFREKAYNKVAATSYFNGFVRSSVFRKVS